MITEWEALDKRFSCRSYRDTMIDAETLAKLSAFVQKLNGESGQHFQLRTSREEGKHVVKLSSAMFRGTVHTCVVLVGGDDAVSSEKVGYYGQRLVLYATQLGLGTCWVAGTYDKKSIPVVTAEGEKLWGIIPIGYVTGQIPAKQKMIRSTMRKKDRKIEQFLESDVAFEDVPVWLKKAILAIRKGPSALNQQPVDIEYKKGRVFAKIWKDGHGLEYIDLGIAKCQFEVSAAANGVDGTWQSGDGGEFAIQSR